MPTSNRIKVSCDSCGLLTKVERNDVLPPCHECGGKLLPMDKPLRAELTPPAEPLAGVRFCLSCDASNPAAARFCENCGEPLAEQQAASGDTGSPRRRPKARSKSLEKRSANIQLGKARITMKRVRGLFIVLAGLYGLALAILFFGFLALKHEGSDTPGLYVFLMFYAACTFSVFILGAVFLPRQPFAWTLALACLMTVDVVLTTYSRFAAGGFGMATIPWLWVLLTVACWTATASMLNVKKLLAEHGDTVGAERFTGKRKRAAEGEIGSRARGRARETTGRSIRRVAIYGAGVVVAVVLVVALVSMFANNGGGGPGSPAHAYDPIKAAERQQQLETSYQPVLSRFLAAWRRSDKPAIAEMASPGSRKSVIWALDRSLERYELSTEELPEIENRRDLWLKRTEGVKTYFSVPATADQTRRAKLKLHWVFSKDEWVLIEARLQGTKRDD